MTEQKPEITRLGVLDMQVCVPWEWTDEQVREFAENHNPSGTIGGWQIRREGSSLLAGMPERMPCEQRKEFVHITLDV